jgi:hypothetical protein
MSILCWLYTPKSVNYLLTFAAPRLNICINDGQYFCTSKRALESFKKDFPGRFKVQFVGTAHWYISARIHQNNNINTNIDHSSYCTKLIVKCYLGKDGFKSDSKVWTSTLCIMCTNNRSQATYPCRIQSIAFKLPTTLIIHHALVLSTIWFIQDLT